MKINNLFDTRKGIETLIYLHKNKENFIYAMALELKITYNHLSKLINFLAKLKLVLKIKKGRKKIISLTKKGVKIARRLSEVQKLI